MGQTAPPNLSGGGPFPPRGGDLGRQHGEGPGPFDVHSEHLVVVEQEGVVDVVGVQHFGVSVVVANSVKSHVVVVVVVVGIEMVVARDGAVVNLLDGRRGRLWPSRGDRRRRILGGAAAALLRGALRLILLRATSWGGGWGRDVELLGNPGADQDPPGDAGFRMWGGGRCHLAGADGTGLRRTFGSSTARCPGHVAMSVKRFLWKREAWKTGAANRAFLRQHCLLFLVLVLELLILLTPEPGGAKQTKFDCFVRSG